MPPKFNLGSVVKALSKSMAKPLGEVEERILPPLEDSRPIEAAPPAKDLFTYRPAPPGTPVVNGKVPPAYDPAGNPAQTPPENPNPLLSLWRVQQLINPKQPGSLPHEGPDPNWTLQKQIQTGQQSEYDTFGLGEAKEDPSGMENPWGPGGVMEARSTGAANGAVAMYPRSAYDGGPLLTNPLEPGRSAFGYPMDMPDRSTYPETGYFHVPGSDIGKYTALQKDFVRQVSNKSFPQVMSIIRDFLPATGAMRPMYENTVRILEDRVKELGMHNVQETMVRVAQVKKANGTPALGYWTWNNNGELIVTSGADLPYETLLHELQHACAINLTELMWRDCPERSLTGITGLRQMRDFRGSKDPLREIAIVDQWEKNKREPVAYRANALRDMVKLRQYVIEYMSKFANMQEVDYTFLGDRPGQVFPNRGPAHKFEEGTTINEWKQLTEKEKTFARMLGRHSYTHLSYQLGSTHEFMASSLGELEFQKLLSMIPMKGAGSALSAANKAALEAIGMTDFDNALAAALTLQEQILSPHWKHTPAIAEYARDSARNLVGSSYRALYDPVISGLSSSSEMKKSMGAKSLKYMIDAVTTHPHLPNALRDIVPPPSLSFQAVVNFWAAQFLEDGTLPTERTLQTLTPKLRLKGWNAKMFYKSGSKTFLTHLLPDDQAKLEKLLPGLDAVNNEINLGKMFPLTEVLDGVSGLPGVRERVTHLIEYGPAVEQFKDVAMSYFDDKTWSGIDKGISSAYYSKLIDTTFGADAEMADALIKHLKRTRYSKKEWDAMPADHQKHELRITLDEAVKAYAAWKAGVKNKTVDEVLNKMASKQGTSPTTS